MTDVSARIQSALAGRYTVEHELGRGGMATVYLARDEKHDRQVALKVLHPELGAVLGAERFLNEIKVTANLQHPHILPLHDSGEADGLLFYVMPYVEGESLRHRLEREHEMAVEDAVRVVEHVASALDYAHRRDIIHRDIKPENILLHEGQALVADFGIALAVTNAGGARLTETGLSLGTPHYMSPEQAAADRELDARSDVYSLGCVAYEMLVGEPPHTGPNAQAILTKIVTELPDPILSRRQTVPVGVAAAVHKAVQKLPADRFATAGELAGALTDHRLASAQALLAVTAAGPPDWRARWFWPAGLAAVGLTAAAVWALGPGANRAGEPGPVTRFTVPVAGGHEMVGGQIPSLALSPDGRVLAYRSEGRLFVRSLDRLEALELESTEGAIGPLFSPDGKWIAFGQDGVLKKVSVTGGPVTVLATVGVGDFFGADWGTDDRIVFGAVDNTGIRRISAGGSKPEQITTLVDEDLEAAHLWPQLLEGGRLLLITVMGASWLWDDAKIVLYDLEDGSRTTLVERGTYGRYVSTGHIVYARADGTLLAVPFDLEHRQVKGTPFPVQSGVRVAYWGGGASFTIAESGTMAFVLGSNWENHHLVWVDRRGRVLDTLGAPLNTDHVELSPDGRRVAIDMFNPVNDDIFLLDATSGQRERLTFEPALNEGPVWSFDGRRVAYTAVAGKMNRILAREVDTGADPVLLFTGAQYPWPLSWSPDGRWIVLQQQHPSNQSDLYALRVDSGPYLVPLAVTAASEGFGQISPNGRWLAYESDGEVFVVSFPEVGGKRQISTGGGQSPRWSDTGDELFFWRDRTLMTSGVSENESFSRLTPPRELFSLPGYDRVYDVSPDAERFLVRMRNVDSVGTEIEVVMNWTADLVSLGEQ